MRHRCDIHFREEIVRKVQLQIYAQTGVDRLFGLRMIIQIEDQLLGRERVNL